MLSEKALDALDHMAKGNMRSRSSQIELSIMKEFDRFVAAQLPIKIEAREQALAEMKEGTK